MVERDMDGVKKTLSGSKGNAEGAADIAGGEWSRRRFLKTTAAATAAVAGAAVMGSCNYVPSHVFRGEGPGGRIRVGQIGAGRIATGHDIPGVLTAGGDMPLADYVAVCDLDSKRAAQGKTFLATGMAKRKTAAPDVAVFTKYEELLASPDIDAVVISLPDHQHAQVCLAAIKAGKDIYMQKPFTMTFEESKMLRDAIVKSGRTFQIGSQQRSWTGGPVAGGTTVYRDQFRIACELVRNGRVGNLKEVEIGLPTDPTQADPREMPIPSNLDYDRWIGPTPMKYYTEDRVHSQSSIGSRPGWLRNEAYCLGMITGWGAHHFDTAHWGMDMELSGPLKAEGRGEFPPAERVWNVHGTYKIELQYPKNIKMTVWDKLQNGIKFIGDEGWIFVTREAGVTSSDPAVSTGLKPLDASSPKLLEPLTDAQRKVKLPYSAEHHLNWLEAIKSGKRNNVAPAPIAHCSNAACIVAWIAMKTGRPLTWDGAKGQFVNDAGANSLLSRPERAGYGAIRASKA